MADLASLIKRVKSAKTCSPNLDTDIHIACGLAEPGAKNYGPYLRRRMRVPAYTFSMDAALDLFDAVLPDHGITIDYTSSATATVWEKDDEGNFVSGEATYQVAAETKQLAVVAAVLSMIATRTDNGGDHG